MNKEVVIITPEFGAGVGGVGDYTRRLSEAWPDKQNLRVLVPKDTAEPLPASGGSRLVQYSAYGFDRYGYPRKLIRALIEWKKKTHGRLVVMFHEIWTFWPVTNQNFFVQLLHRRAIKHLLQHTDEVFTSTQSQAELLRALSSRTPVRVLPVGSNIRRNGDVDLARITGCAVIFGLQRARIRGLRRMQSSLRSLATAGFLTKIISIGAGKDPSLDRDERTLLSSLQLKEGFNQRGAVPEQEISAILLSASFGIFAHDELSLTKSGTFMAYAAHELNVLAEFADGLKPAPICWLVAPPDLLGRISASELKLRAKLLCEWQRENSSWELIARSFAEALDLSEISLPGTIHP